MNTLQAQPSMTQARATSARASGMAAQRATEAAPAPALAPPGAGARRSDGDQLGGLLARAVLRRSVAAAGTPSRPAAGLLQRDAGPQFGSCGQAVTGVRNAPAAIEEGRQRAIAYVQAARTVLATTPRRGTTYATALKRHFIAPNAEQRATIRAFYDQILYALRPANIVCEGDRNRCGNFQAGWMAEDDMIHICRPFFPLNTTCRAIVLVHEAAHDADVDAAETGHPPYRGWTTYPAGAEAPVVPVTTQERMANPDAYAYFAAHIWRETDTGICTTPGG